MAKDTEQRGGNRAVSSGISMGAALAMVISWGLHKSIVWAILHGVCGWLYVIYFAFTRAS